MPSTIPDLFDDAVAAAPSKVWLHMDGRAFTFEEAHAFVERAASAVAARGVRPGHLVLATAHNTPEYLFAWLGTVYAGGIIVAVNPRAGENELAGLVRQVGPRLIVTDSEAADAVRRAGGDTIDVAELYSEPAGPTPPRPGPDDPAALIPTSGTTGRSKLVTQTHRAYAMAGEGFPWWMELGPDDRLMTSLPLFHINAPAYSVLGSIAARAGLVLLPRFSASTFLDSSRRHGATEFNAIGAMLEILMRQPAREDDADTPLRLCYTGPAPPEARQLEIERRFGLRIVCGYALSESPYGMIWPRDEPPPYGSVGRLRQHPRLGRVNEALVVDDHGSPVEPGAAGELLLRNPAVMLGYYRLPDETAATRRDGWLHTGDLVRQDEEGLYYFLGRKKEVIRRRGENLSPREVELVLDEHPAVAECAVVGVPDSLSEEEVKAFVLPVEGSTPTAAELREWCTERLTPFKVPRYYEFVAEFPRTPTNRIAKHRLPRERTAAEADVTG